jgi:hypothetical protein
MEGVCLECGTEMPYDWAPCPNCGWKAPDAWETEAEIGGNTEDLPVFLSKDSSWISRTVWILLAILLLGFVLMICRYF